MNKRIMLTMVGITALGTTLAIAGGPEQHQEMQLPPGMTMEDMQLCMEAGTPGEMHAFLAEGVGEWQGKSTMWMTPEAEPVTSECTSTVTIMMDGRFTKCEWTGDIPGAGPFHGFGIFGYDNVAEEFQATWIDNCGTGMAIGTGELASDGKTLTWTFTYNCPITQKPAKLREIQRYTGKNTMTFEIYATHPHSGKEYKMMACDFVRKSSDRTVSSAR